MDVVQLLGLDNSLVDAGRCWPSWVREHPVLAIVTGPDQLAELVEKGGRRQEVDAPLRALALLASCEHGDDVRAAATLCRVLERFARGVAWKVRSAYASSVGSVDEVEAATAAQLWIVARTFAPQSCSTFVTTHLYFKLLRAVLLDYGITVRQSEGKGKALPRPEVAVDHTAPEYAALFGVVDPEPHTSVLVEQLLDDARRSHLVDEHQEQIVRALLDAAETLPSRRKGSTTAGLLTRAAQQEVSAQLGMTPNAVLHHARKALAALSTTAHAAA